MKVYFNSKTNGFYNSLVHGDKIPVGSVEITSEQYQLLLEGQAAGKPIKGDDKGNPFNADPQPVSDEQLSVIERSKRDNLIAATDYLVMPDYPIGTELLDKVKVYRQLLRDITEQDGFPTVIGWPINPMDEVSA